MSPTTTVSPVAPARVGAAAAGLVAAGLLVSGSDDGVVLCPIRRCTGGYCPGCGATRAAHRLLGGDVAGAWGRHPWVVLAAAQAVTLVFVLAATTPSRRRDRGRRLLLPAALANAALLLAICIVRLAAGAIPAPL